MQDDNQTYRHYGLEDIKRYLNGGMTAQEMHEMEKAALKDPFLADAMDGFSKAVPVTSEQHLKEIRAKILDLDDKKGAVTPINSAAANHQWRWAVAACSLAILAGGAWWVTQNLRQKDPVSIAVIAMEKSNEAGINAPHDAASSAKVDLSHSSKIDEKEEKSRVAIIAAAPKITSKRIEKRAANKPVVEVTAVENSPNLVLADQPESRKNEAIQRKELSARAPQKLMAQAPVSQSQLLITGKITDASGNSIPSAIIKAGKNPPILAKQDGSFSIASADSFLNVEVENVGYENAIATLRSANTNQITLPKSESALNEVVVTRLGMQKRKALTGAIKSIPKSNQQVELDAHKNAEIFPEGGWFKFYQDLRTDLKVKNSKTYKTLQIKFGMDSNGHPNQFQVVESPNEKLTEKAIEFIKKTKWINYQPDQTTTIKLEVK